MPQLYNRDPKNENIKTKTMMMRVTCRCRSRCRCRCVTNLRIRKNVSSFSCYSCNSFAVHSQDEAACFSVARLVVFRLWLPHPVYAGLCCLHLFPTNYGQSVWNSAKVQSISTVRMPNHARTAEMPNRRNACTISELHALLPKLVGKRSSDITV